MLLLGIPFRFLFALVIQAACSPFKTWHAQHMVWYGKVWQGKAKHCHEVALKSQTEILLYAELMME